MNRVRRRLGRRGEQRARPQGRPEEARAVTAQLAMFDLPAPAERAIQKSALGIGPWRYELRRIWDDGKPLLVVCMLNPSTADGYRDDQTIRTLIHFGQLWGYGGLYVVNLFAFRSSSPAEMMRQPLGQALGADNAAYVIDAIGYARDHGKSLLAAWGNHGSHHRMDEWLEAEAHLRLVDLICLGTTLSGQPKHPLARGKHRIPRDQQPLIWRSAA